MNLVISVTVFLSLILLISTEDSVTKELLIQWDAKLTCNIHQRYCFLLEISASKFSLGFARNMVTHPHICTEKSKTGISRQMHLDLDGIRDMIDSNPVVANQVSILHNCTLDDNIERLKMDLKSINLTRPLVSPYNDLRPKIMVIEFEVDLTDNGQNCNGPEDSTCNWAPEVFAKDGHFFDNTDILKSVQRHLN